MADVFSFRCFPDLSYLWIHMAYIPVPNVIPRVLLCVISRFESDKLQFT